MKNKRTILIAAAGTVAVLCIGCLALVLLTDTTPAPEATATTATEPLASVDTPAPTLTPAPAEPTPTPTVSMLTVRDIERKRGELTDLQWENYSQEVVGEPIRFAGKIFEVFDDGSVYIREGKGFFTGCTLYEIPLDVAAALNKDQFVRGVGMVRSVDTLLGLMVNIDVESLE